MRRIWIKLHERSIFSVVFGTLRGFKFLLVANILRSVPYLLVRQRDFSALVDTSYQEKLCVRTTKKKQRRAVNNDMYQRQRHRNLVKPKDRDRCSLVSKKKKTRLGSSSDHRRPLTSRRQDRNAHREEGLETCRWSGSLKTRLRYYRAPTFARSSRDVLHLATRDSPQCRVFQTNVRRQVSRIAHAETEGRLSHASLNYPEKRETKFSAVAWEETPLRNHPSLVRTRR